MTLLFFISLAVKVIACDVNILLLHTNDMHARFKEVDRYLGTCKDPTSLSCFGGFARLHETVRKCKEEAKSEGRLPIFLNAGDNFQGTTYYSVFKWGIVTKFVNGLGIDAMSLGNHEFDDGIGGLAPFLKAVKTPVVCCNMDWSKEPELQNSSLRTSIVLEFEGIKIGIIGYLTPIISKGNIGNITIFDEIACVTEEAQILRKRGVKIIIALGHSGYAKDLEIAKKISDVDLVVGGHSHSFLYTGSPPDIEEPIGEYPTVVTQTSGKQVLVVQAFFGTKYLGRLALDFDTDGDLKSFNGTPILLTGNMPQSSNILQMLDPYESGNVETKRIIGSTHVVLDNSNGHCRVSECEIGNMIVDAYVNFAVGQCSSDVTEGWTIASIGMTQAGSIRASIDAVTGHRNGSITLEDVMTAVPFGNRVVVIRLNGTTILGALEHGIEQMQYGITTHNKNLLQVSGLRVKFDIARNPGNRIVDVKVMCADCKMPIFEDLIETKEYGVVVPEYLANGGSGFTMFRGHKVVCISNDTDYMVISKYIEKFSPINPQIESRIVFMVDKTNTIILVSLILLFTPALLYYYILYGKYLLFSQKTHDRILNNIFDAEEVHRTLLPSRHSS